MTKIILSSFLLSSFLFAELPLTLSHLTNPNEELTTWIALFGLGLIAILALFISSEKIRAYKKEIEEANSLKENIQKQHNTILSNMGENIQTIAEENFDAAKKLSQTNNALSQNKDIQLIEDSESKLLSIATNLIEFLRLKSKKIEIRNEKLSLSNLLNDVSGTLKDIIKETPLELHYIIDYKLKENIYADTLNLSKILVNILLYSIDNKADKLTLNISDKSNSLYFTLHTNIKLDASDPDAIFSAEYNEKSSSYESLGLFVAREICQLMGGKLIAENDSEGNLEFIFNINYEKDTKSIDTIKIKNKKILIVDQSNEAALSCKNIFKSLEHHVTIIKIQDYLLNLPNFSQFDIVILDEMLFTKSAITAFKTSDTIVSLSNLFGTSHNKTVQKHTTLSLQKPCTKKQVQNLLEKIYKKNTQEDISSNISNTTKALVYKDTLLDYKDVTLDKFSKFRKINILLVEDNFINQKVFLGILSRSGINIVTANDGQEALNQLSENIKFDIIFMDINMPIMDGYTATKHIREDERYNMLPIVALTALTSKPEIDSMFDTGMNAYLAKPLKKEKLFSVLSLFITDKKDERRKSVRYEERIVKLNGLDIGIGIKNSNSNDFFYKEILSEFQDAYGESDKIFTKLVEDFRYEQLRMLCLDIRGLAASIGAEDMNLLTTEVLKLLLFKKYDILKDFVPLYLKSLHRLNIAINEYTSN